jgi:ABC-2 type transport system permease protein
MLWIINLASTTGSEIFRAIFSWLSLLKHFNSLINGAVNSVDVIYYLIICSTFIVLSIWRLDGERRHQ